MRNVNIQNARVFAIIIENMPKTNTPKKPGRFHRWFAKRPVRYGVAIGGLVLAGGLIAFAIFFRAPKQEVAVNAVPDKSEKYVPPTYHSPLTGMKVNTESITKRPVTAVMIENSPDARPQSGLKNMGVVYEAVAEGGITRFVGLYQESEPALIGPVRSLRPYYVEWAAPFDPAVAHVGGSLNSLNMIRSGNYGVDLDQFFNDGAYWRTADRWAPHNVYTDYAHLRDLENSKGKATSSFAGFPRTDGKPFATPDATHVHMGVSTGTFDVTYDFDAASNTYIRKQGGENHVDRENGQIQPSVAIAIRVQMTLGFEDGYREQIPTSGNGECFVFQNGVAQHCIWKKASDKEQIQFIGDDGNPIKLNRGQTWITAVPQENDISWQ